MLAPRLKRSEPIQLALKRLAEFFRVLSNSRRILIIEELRDGEKDVTSLTEALHLQQSAISKHLAGLRTHKLVVERKDGRNVYYRLNDPDIASWIVDGLKYAGPNLEDTNKFLLGVEQVKSAWDQTSPEDEI